MFMSRQKDVRQPPRAPSSALPETRTISGKVVIVTIGLVAILAAGFSWWFRYSSTVRAAKFWGPVGVELIRNPGSSVQLIHVQPMGDTGHEHNSGGGFADHYHTLGGVVEVVDRRDVTRAHGLVHLRNELLMDRSFHEELSKSAADDWRTGLEFRDAAGSAPLVVFFSADCRRMMRIPAGQGADFATTSSEFAEGLNVVFTEWSKPQAADGGE